MAQKDQKIIDLVSAQEETTKDLSKRIVRVEKLVEKQESRNNTQQDRNQNALYAVLVAFILVIISVAVEVILSTKHDDSIYDSINGRIDSLQTQISNTQNEVDVLRARNSYLK